MRAFHYLTPLTFILASVAGYWYWDTGRDSFRAQTRNDEIIRGLLIQYKTKYPAQGRLALEALQGSRGAAELVDPTLALPQTFRYPWVEISRLSSYAETCDPRIALTFRTSHSIHLSALKKAAHWHRYLCKQRSTLPDSFFETSPYMHPSGASYVWLALHSGRSEFEASDWIKKNESRLHLLEMIKLSAGANPLLKNLNSSDLSHLVEGDSVVLTTDAAFLRDDQDYAIYPLVQWTSFIRSTPYRLVTSSPSVACILRDGNHCWTNDPGLDRIRNRWMALGLASGFTALGIAWGITSFRRSRQQKREAAQRIFVLQMLTHELRTPAAALKLSIEVLRRQFDELPEHSQRAFLQMCEELQRLDRVVEASKNYLNLSVDSRRLASVADSLPSINQLIEAVIEPYGSKIRFFPLPVDRPWRINRYWIELCLINLIENALAHGQAPVVVRLREEAGSLMLSIEDQGSTPFATWKELAEPFKRGEKSRGLGLGLAIVHQVIGALGGEIHFRSNPTTFTIYLRLES